jgi:hypothetical protein
MTQIDDTEPHKLQRQQATTKTGLQPAVYSCSPPPSFLVSNRVGKDLQEFHLQFIYF